MEKNYNLNGHGANLNFAVRNVATTVSGSAIIARAIPSVICRTPTMPWPVLAVSATVALVLGVRKRIKRKSSRK